VHFRTVFVAIMLCMIEIPRIQAVLTDVDNTLLYAGDDGHSVITPHVIDSIAAAESLGVKVLPATSRTFQLMEKVQRAVGFSHSGVLDNGASVYDFAENKYVSRRWLPARTVQAAVDAIRGHCTLLSCGSVYTQSPADLDVGRLEEAPTVFAEYDVAREDEIYFALGGLFEICRPTNPMYTPDPNIRCVQVMLPEANKMTGAQIALQYEGLEDAALMAVGDNTHDDQLFAAVGDRGVKVAMGDAPDYLKNLANVPPVPDARHDGLAHALWEYVITPGLLQP
jgi:hydroxymethylpyrimidine pyrophosphatase-like HAD family hydrolase